LTERGPPRAGKQGRDCGSAAQEQAAGLLNFCDQANDDEQSERQIKQLKTRPRKPPSRRIDAKDERTFAFRRLQAACGRKGATLRCLLKRRGRKAKAASMFIKIAVGGFCEFGFYSSCALPEHGPGGTTGRAGPFATPNAAGARPSWLCREAKAREELSGR